MKIYAYIQDLLKKCIYIHCFCQVSIAGALLREFVHEMIWYRTVSSGYKWRNSLLQYLPLGSYVVILKSSM